MTPIVKVSIGLAAVVVVLFAALLLFPASQPAAPVAAKSGVSISFDDKLAQQGASVFTSKYACNGCHAVSALNVAGSTAGPDLSRVILGEVPTGTAPQANPISRWYADNGLNTPATNLEKASELLFEYLEMPPSYSALMQSQVQRAKGVAGSDDKWEEDAKAIVEFLKKAAAGGSK
ncbi:MAG: hypothetical protein M1358_01055 [Chloroflexi bacterium]|nr:hypothetical protein [Chloroflexota bacterium]